MIREIFLKIPQELTLDSGYIFKNSSGIIKTSGNTKTLDSGNISKKSAVNIKTLDSGNIFKKSSGNIKTLNNKEIKKY